MRVGRVEPTVATQVYQNTLQFHESLFATGYRCAIIEAEACTLRCDLCLYKNKKSTPFLFSRTNVSDLDRVFALVLVCQV